MNYDDLKITDCLGRTKISYRSGALLVGEVLHTKELFTVQDTRKGHRGRWWTAPGTLSDIIERYPPDEVQSKGGNMSEPLTFKRLNILAKNAKTIDQADAWKRAVNTDRATRFLSVFSGREISEQ